MKDQDETSFSPFPPTSQPMRTCLSAADEFACWCWMWTAY